MRGTFTARYGPDRTFLESFTLTANDEAGVTRMLADAVVRIDAAYTRALEQGLLKPDPTIRQGSGMDPALVALVEQLIGPGVSVYFSQIFFKPPEGGGPKPAHQDNFYFGPTDPEGMVTAWIALDDALQQARRGGRVPPRAQDAGVQRAGRVMRDRLGRVGEAQERRAVGRGPFAVVRHAARHARRW